MNDLGSTDILQPPPSCRTSMAPTSPLQQVRHFGLTTDEHIEELRLAPVGAMVQLDGGPPTISSLIDSAPPAEPAAAAEKAQPEPSGRSQSPEVAVALAPHADTASDDGYQTAPSAPEVSPPAFPSVSPAAPGGRRSRCARCFCYDVHFHILGHTCTCRVCQA